MEHENVYRLSERYAPPNIDLRAARVLDCYGYERSATYPIDHNHPNDVTREDLNAYPQGWAFMGLRDMLFYLYPIAKEFEADPDTMDDYCCVSFFLDSLDRHLENDYASLKPLDRDALHEGLQWLRDIDSDSDDPLFDNPLFNYQRLRKILGLPPLEDPTHDE